MVASTTKTLSFTKPMKEGDGEGKEAELAAPVLEQATETRTSDSAAPVDPLMN